MYPGLGGQRPDIDTVLGVFSACRYYLHFPFHNTLILGLAAGVVAAPRLRADAVVRPPARPQLRRRHRDQQTAVQRGNAGLRHKGVQGEECYLASFLPCLYIRVRNEPSKRPNLPWVNAHLAVS